MWLHRRVAGWLAGRQIESSFVAACWRSAYVLPQGHGSTTPSCSAMPISSSISPTLAAQVVDAQWVPLLQGTVARLTREGSPRLGVTPSGRCRSALWAAQLRLLLGFLHSERLTERCPLVLEAGCITETIAACFIYTPLPEQEQRDLDAQLCWVAVWEGDVAEVERLDREGASADAKSVGIPAVVDRLYDAVDGGDPSLAQRCRDARARLELELGLGAGAAVERLAGEGKDEEGWPAVVEAAAEGHTEVVEALLRLGCYPNAPGRNGTTALMAAALNGQVGVVAALLEHGGADLDAVSSNGKTALMLAAIHGQAAVAAQLVDAGADATLRATGGRYEGKTALEMAEARGRWDSKKQEIVARATHVTSCFPRTSFAIDDYLA
eukprot:COSAG01_NODE_511_length_16061_cov_15.815875_3_plen_381_part_00